LRHLVEASPLPKKENNEEKGWLGRKNLGSLFRDTSCLETIIKPEISPFKGPKSVKI